MRFRSIVQTALVFAALATLAACSDDDNGPAPTAGPSFTRTATATQGAANTATATKPPATSTATATVPPPSATATQQAEATSTPTQEVAATDTPTAPLADTPTPTETPTAEAETPTETPTVASAGLGVRELTVKRPGSEFDTSALAGIDVSLDPWLPATLKLEAGTPDENGVASIQLQEDVILGWTVIDTSVACMKLLAAGSSGTVACNGGVAQSVVMTADSNGEGGNGPITIMTGQGDPSPAGSLYFTLTRSVAVNLPPGSSVQGCLTADYAATEAGVFTSATGQAVLLNPAQGGSELILEKTGQAFDCSDWTNPDGPGQLVGPVLGFDQVIGDVANILFLSGHTVE